MGDLKELGNGWFIFDDAGFQRRVAMARDGDTTWVFFEGNTYTISQDNGATWKKTAGSRDVMAPMPATVVAINTGVGNTVGEGDTVIVLEAMKMELPIKAPRAGVVKAIHCTKGELVQPGVNLIEIE